MRLHSKFLKSPDIYRYLVLFKSQTKNENTKTAMLVYSIYLFDRLSLRDHRETSGSNKGETSQSCE